MFEVIFSAFGVGFAGICAMHVIDIIIAPDTHKEEMMKQFIKEREDRENKFALALKRANKYRFINKFIDEIPELSYYEAAQLKKKLGNIYLEWNDE